MRGSNLLVDTNVVVDFLGAREPHFESARLLMLVGRAREFNLWISSSQVTDLIYILSEGGKPHLVKDVLGRIDGLLSFVRIYAVDEEDVRAIVRTDWLDPEDALVDQVAKRIEAAAIITRNGDDFIKSAIPVFDCPGFFEHCHRELGIDYAEIAI